MLHINDEGELVLVNQNGIVFWLANSTKKVLNPIALLLDSRNLLLRDGRTKILRTTYAKALITPLIHCYQE